MIEDMELNIQTTEGTDLNYSFAQDDLPSFIKTRERMRTIKDLIHQRGEKYKEFENQIDPERHNLEKQFEQVQEKINLIKVKDGMYAPYDDEDPIFDLEHEISKEEQEKFAAECPICKKQHAKMKNWYQQNKFIHLLISQFCGSLNCPQCVSKSRPYPVKNPAKDKRGQICLICNKKFLYRDAMHEFAVQLDMKEGVNQNQLEELQFEEETYNELMTLLTGLREMKNNNVMDIKIQADDTINEEKQLNQDIEALKQLKEILVQKSQQLEQSLEQKRNLVDDHQEDIRKIKMKKLENEVQFCQKKYDDITYFNQRRLSVKIIQNINILQLKSDGAYQIEDLRQGNSEVASSRQESIISQDESAQEQRQYIQKYGINGSEIQDQDYDPYQEVKDKALYQEQTISPANKKQSIKESIQGPKQSIKRKPQPILEDEQFQFYNQQQETQAKETMQRANRRSSHIDDGNEFNFGIGAFSKKIDRTQKKSQILMDEELEYHRHGGSQQVKKQSIKKQNPPGNNETVDDPQRYGGVPTGSGLVKSSMHAKMKGKKYQSAAKEGSCQSCEQVCAIY
ncbi:UNKNOWN [Stylonychia lemnae]|uniref:Uncharacterized protein n=1 Tax=Stylonychia lemnae TaxID=5949 RepID=A0A078A5H1_STYLE|nr:UNKNOWN [Stylonychia lemnae]|eukprot:CDW76830.1 UNKNOWN [Stylonychia lemnae]